MNDMRQPVNRRQFIGGSDVAAILGISKWMTPLQLWLKKTDQVTEDISPEKLKLFERGHRWEPIALEMLLDVLEARGHQVELLCRNQRYNDPAHPYMAVEIDAELMLDGEHTNVELKTVHPFASKDWGAMDTDEIPIYYNAQAMFGLGVTGRRGVVGCLIGADDMTPYIVERDDETIAAIRGKVSLFWNEHVLPGIPPSAIDFEDLRYLFAKDNGKEKDAAPGIAEKIVLLQEIRSRIKSYEKDAEKLEFEIQEFMQDAAALKSGDKILCTWKAQVSSRLDQKLLAAEHPDVYANCKRPSESRVFRLK